ncbi:MAG TPA: HNH endonuclease [Candidatus Saccharimonadales bacterium]|nr:HNH endonuclease [Candidatus Saccharimonadales bacterium]
MEWAEIPIINKKNECIAYAIVDLKKVKVLSQYSFWKNTQGYAMSNLKVSMAELVVGKKADNGYVIDHKNLNKLDNREKNLHFATNGFNSQNHAKKENCTSKFIGVRSDKIKGQWSAQINKNGKNIHLGIFKNEIDAAKMYDIHVIDYYKEFEPQTNNLLTKEEIEDIRKNGIPEKYQKKIRDLPKNISINKRGQYVVQINKYGKRTTKNVKTLGEAIILKDKFLKEYDNILNTKNQERLTDIIRNEKGIAIIKMNCGIDCEVDDNVWINESHIGWNSTIDKDGSISYPSGWVDGKSVYLHKYIYEKYVGPIPDKMTIDHIKSDNIFDIRLTNLRLADRSLQAHNKNKLTTCIDKYKGVTFNGSNYQVNINNIYYGSFETEEEAALKANEIYPKIYGENAKLNDINFSKQTTKENRISSDMITKEFILNITKVTDLKNIVIIKNLNVSNGGQITLKKINLNNLENYKLEIINKLFPKNQ